MEISPTVSDAPTQNTAFPGSTLLQYWCCVASSLPTGKCLWVFFSGDDQSDIIAMVGWEQNAKFIYSLGIVFISEFTTLARSWTPENFLPASSSFKGGKRQKSHDARLALYNVWGKTWIFLVLQDVELQPLFCGDWRSRTFMALVLWGLEEKDILQGGDWVLAADFLENFGQKHFCTIWPSGGAVIRQNISCPRRLVLEEDGKQPLPALKSGLAELGVSFWPSHALFLCLLAMP